jgi:hypothetical protein
MYAWGVMFALAAAAFHDWPLADNLFKPPSATSNTAINKILRMIRLVR